MTEGVQLVATARARACVKRGGDAVHVTLADDLRGLTPRHRRIGGGSHLIRSEDFHGSSRSS